MPKQDKQDRYCLATIRSQLVDHPVAPGEWHARRSYHGQPGLWIPGSPLRSAPDDRRQSPRSGAIDHAADAFFGFLKNSFQDQRMKNDKYVLEHILRPSQLNSGGGAWI
jgi:hypothetical protein